MKRSLAVAALVCTAACFAQTKKAGLTAGEVIEKSIAATGGRAAVAKLASTYAKGTMEFPNTELHGIIELYAKAPNKQLLVTNIEGLGELKQGFDGRVAWGLDPSGRITELSGTALEDMKREATFNAPLHWRDLYPKAELTGQETIGDRQAYAIQLTTKTGKTVVRYYDTGTFLLLRETSERDTPEGTVAIKADFSDYRNVGGTKAPFVIRQTLPIGEVVLNISEMKNNIAIDDAVFSKPK